MKNAAKNEVNYAAEKVEAGYVNLNLQIDSIIDFMKNEWGKEYYEAAIDNCKLTDLIQSKNIEDKILALQKLILKKDTYIDDPLLILENIEKKITKLAARNRIENNLQVEVQKYIEDKQDKLIDDIKLGIIKKQRGIENSKTLEKLVNLEKLDTVKLSKSIIDYLRPSSIDEIVGQKKAVSSILSKLASPYPQHILLYGPPGVGKTTTARLALSMVKKLKSTPFGCNAPFVEVNGTTLRWDPREITNPLLGSVHDPIYQGTKRDLAETGVPEPKLGLVTKAHGGVLFIDEIGELDCELQYKLLKVLEDKKVEFSSSYYDPDDETVPQYIKKLFNEGAPADFILIGATTRQPEEINPALRSRCTEVYFEPLSKNDIQKIVLNASKKLKIKMDDEVPEIISCYTIEGRKAVNLLADAYGYVVYNRGIRNLKITSDDLYEVISQARLVPYNKNISNKNMETGKTLGLGVQAFIGSVLEIEAVAFEKQESAGTIRFNDTAGSMAKDSVFNAASAIRLVTGIDIGNYDIHVNVVGGANVDGPSAGAAITIAMLSAVTKKPLRQDIAITGEISLHGRIKPVGGIIEKVYGASQAGIKKVIIPEENKNDIKNNVEGIEIIPVSSIKEIMDIVFRG